MKVYIIYNKEQFTKDQIITDIRSEGYAHNFYFDDKENYQLDYIEESDEIWIFGEVREYISYKFATELGKDIWTMG